MEKFKITIRKITEYPEKQDVYEGDNGKRYYSMYHEDITKNSVKVTKKTQDTGKMLVREDDVYIQEIETVDIRNVIKAINNL